MKVTAGSLSDEQREILWESNRTGRRVCVHAREDCWVGTVTTWDHDEFVLGGWSFQTRIAWTHAVAVWWREEAPDPCPFLCQSTARAMEHA